MVLYDGAETDDSLQRAGQGGGYNRTGGVVPGHSPRGQAGIDERDTQGLFHSAGCARHGNQQTIGLSGSHREAGGGQPGPNGRDGCRRRPEHGAEGAGTQVVPEFRRSRRGNLTDEGIKS